MTTPPTAPAIRATGLSKALRQAGGTPVGSDATAIATGLTVVMALLGDFLSPMEGLGLDAGRPAPLYGHAALAHWPLTGGGLATGDDDPLWLPLANVAAWTTIFAFLALWGVRRDRARV